MRRAARLVLIALATLGIAWPASAAPPAQADDLTSGLNATMCGGDLPGDTHFTLAATGDTFPHENIQAVGEAQGYDVLFEQVRPFLQAADLAYTNFDGAMLAGAGYTGYPNFNFNPALAGALKNAGIDLVSTANNHILDRGPEGLDATMQVLDQNSILHHGTVPSTSNAAPRPPYLRIPISRDGVTVNLGFLSASWGTNGIPDPFNQVNLLFETNSYGADSSVRPGILENIAQAKRENDLVVVAAHWGVEYEFYPRATQTAAARRLAEAGADIILGAQPHTLQPVDIIDTNGRKTLVIYSLANFLASQGAFQAEFYSATSVVFYIGMVRGADGQVRVTGFRYLPTIHVENDTRPAPIPPQGYEDVIGHVRTILRDGSGARQISHDPSVLGPRVEVCPRLGFPENPELQIGGDFAEFYRTLGGSAPVDREQALAVLGLPSGPPRQELAGDCQRQTSVLYTPFQRLEWHAEADWPYRVVGTQLGLAVYAQKTGLRDIPRGDLSAITRPAFRSFYEQRGGMALFGLPISPELQENQATVQYFERARFELASADPSVPLDQQVRLGRLGDEYAGIAAQCNLPAPTAVPQSLLGGAQPLDLTAQQPSTASTPPQTSRWMWIGIVVTLLACSLGGLLLLQQATRPRASARVRDRGLRSATLARPQVQPGQTIRPPARPPIDDDEALRQLLGL
ncbi:MAG: CapA family protein [Roseiflexaceae bacterium]|nr:CapA family protein [Roseiflexaceae bacterium]